MYHSVNMYQVFIYLIEHHRLYAVTKQLSKFSSNYRFATTLKKQSQKLLSPQIYYTECKASAVHYRSNTLGPITHISLPMCDWIISAISWEWLGVLMKVLLLLCGFTCLVPTGTLR